MENSLLVISDKITCTIIAHAFFQNHPQLLLHFLMHIDILMLCIKFEPILTKKVFELWPFLKIAHALSKKWLRNHTQFLLPYLIL